MLYYQTFGGVAGVLFHSEETVLWIIFLLNTSVLWGWEFAARRWKWLQVAWARRLLATAGGVAMTWLCMIAIFEKDASSFAQYTWLGWSLLLYGLYRWVKPDLFMLAGGCMSGICVIMAFLTTHLLTNIDEGGLLLLAMLMIGLGTGAAIWLKNLNKEMSS